MSDAVAEMSSDAPEIRRLTFDVDVEVCVIGGGLAGLSVALEAARMGANVAVLEAKRIGNAASGHHLGTVKPGFDVAVDTVIARTGRKAAAELWRMSQIGAEIVRNQAASMPDAQMSEGALEVSRHARGDKALALIQDLGTDFGFDVEHWDKARVRDVLDTGQYFGALHHPHAFQVDSAPYLKGLAAIARQAGVRIYEDTPVTQMDASGSRKRIVTPAARLRASHVVLAGNVHLETVLPRLSATLLPVWRYGAISEPLGQERASAIGFAGSVSDTDGIDQFRVLSDGRLMWASPETTWQGRAGRSAGAIRRRIARIFPTLGRIAIAQTFAGAVGQTVHGMPQIGQIRPGLWVASGFGRQGMNTTAMAGRVIAQGILVKDDRWRLFGPFDLIWAGGRTGQVAGYAIEQTRRGRAAAASAWARQKEKAARQAELRASRIAAVTGRGPSEPPTAKPSGLAASEAFSTRDPLPPSPFLEMPAGPEATSQESERQTNAPA